MTIGVNDIKKSTKHLRRSYDIYGTSKCKVVTLSRVEVVDLYDDLVRGIKSGKISSGDAQYSTMLGILRDSLVEGKFREVSGHLSYLALKV